MNRDFRRAIQCAVNKEEIKDKIWYGDTVVLDIDMCPNYAAYPTVEDGIEVVDYDPERAKKLLKDSGYKGEEFTITVEDGSMLEDVAELICDQLSEIGIHCRVDDITSEEFYNVRIKRMYQATIVDNICSLMDADGMLTAHNADGPYFEERLFERDPEIIELLEKGRAVQGEERIPFYVKACNIITEEAYEVPLVNNLSTIAFNNKLTGVEAHCLGLCYFVDWKWE
jgi:peptide/nickel transport system substrate-binding protein